MRESEMSHSDFLAHRKKSKRKDVKTILLGITLFLILPAVAIMGAYFGYVYLTNKATQEQQPVENPKPVTDPNKDNDYFVF